MANTQIIVLGVSGKALLDGSATIATQRRWRRREISVLGEQVFRRQCEH
jgi:hypothetical protein